jgi:hypothetical protein
VWLVEDCLERVLKKEIMVYCSTITDLLEELSKIRNTVDDLLREFQTPTFSSMKLGTNH